MLPIETHHDMDANMVWAEVDELGTYCIIDLGKWLNELDKVTDNEEFYIEESDTDNSLMLLNSDVKAKSMVETSRTLMINDTSIADNYMKYTFNGNTYSIIENKMTWPNAKLYCEKLGGHLVTISSKEENNFVQGILKRRNLNYYTAIGYSDTAQEGVWEWVTSERSSYTNWDLKYPEPNNGIGMGEQDYAFMISDGTWDDGFLGSTAIFICEWEKQYGPTFDYISSTGLSGLTLKAPLKKISKVNSDSDTLTDSDEINWNLIINGKLSTLGELMDSKEQKGYVVEGLSRMSSSYQAASRCKPILPILSDPIKEDGDEDGIWDDKDPNKLRKDTIETMFKLSQKNNKKNPKYIEIHDNTIKIYLKLYITKEDDVDEKYVQLVKSGITKYWTTSFTGNDYDFYDGIKGNTIVYIDAISHGEGEMAYRERVYLKKYCIPMNSSGGLTFNLALGGNPTLPTIADIRWDDKNRTYTDPEFESVAAHEIGHSLGLWDAYPEANIFASPLKPNVEIPEETMMWYNKRVTSNDIEMVLQAFVENRQQHYYDSSPYKKSVVVRCPQEFH
ncbi:lectin-like protein [Cellulosilyticum lentocellum]|uniref:C-type lectin domain protein n=1 Tax=Cellulosilyticum lentocellum (strain ATCC 49066 / DSM 5427 / NCIMB 11756 / RHM5) TaxID=642492 RepID=F2JPK9_CELLD|nr:lectin-like protein [Cellulosilyticum lentocellum]ADZ83669.1 C-type lectin domain protein [Cellulosilyticum lentocellum DSM 5427]